MNIIDVRDQLPSASWRIGSWGPKTSATIHWNGPPIAPGTDPLEFLKGDARYHMSKDWSPAPGIQGADGIMYHLAIAPDGRAFQTRDLDAVLWHSGSETGNERSLAIQVMVGGRSDGTADPLTSTTPEQFATLAEVIEWTGLDDIRPHRAWSLTVCPGNELADWVLRRRWEDTMTADQERKLDRILALLESREPLVWAARAQRGLDVERQATPFDAARPPLDPRV